MIVAQPRAGCPAFRPGYRSYPSRPGKGRGAKPETGGKTDQEAARKGTAGKAGEVETKERGEGKRNQ